MKEANRAVNIVDVDAAIKTKSSMEMSGIVQSTTIPLNIYLIELCFLWLFYFFINIFFWGGCVCVTAQQ